MTEIILDRALAPDENQKGLRDIYELFLKTPGMPVIENEDVLFDAVKEGGQNGFIGVKAGTEIYYKQSVSPGEDLIILRGQIAKEIKERELQKEEVIAAHPESLTSPQTTTQKAGVKHLTLRAKIPWDKLSEIISGVIRPLKEKGHLQITIEIEAEAEEEFDSTTLDTKVRETLQQIGAKIEKLE